MADAMNAPRTGGKMADGRFRTTRQYKGPDGLPVSKVFAAKKGETKRAVIDRADEWLVTNRGSLPSPKMRLRRAFDLWIDYKEGQQKADRTIEDYQETSDLICAKYGELAVSSLSAFHVDELIREWVSQGKMRTAKKIRDIGRNAFNYFIRNKWVAREEGNPFKDADPVAYEVEDETEPIPIEDFEKSLATVKKPVHRALLLALRYTGVRPVGIRTLLRSEIRDQDDGMWMRKFVKSRNSKKWNPVPRPAAEAIRALPVTSVFVFPNRDGAAFSESGIAAIWRDAQVKAKLENIRPLYDLRHMRASELIDLAADKGIDVVYVTRQLGHSKAALTRERYHQQQHATLRELAEGE